MQCGAAAGAEGEVCEAGGSMPPEARRLQGRGAHPPGKGMRVQLAHEESHDSKAAR